MLLRASQNLFNNKKLLACLKFIKQLLQARRNKPSDFNAYEHKTLAAILVDTYMQLLWCLTSGLDYEKIHQITKNFFLNDLFDRLKH